MIDIKDIGHMIVFISAWIMTNISIVLAVIIMILQIYILILKIKRMRRDGNIQPSN